MEWLVEWPGISQGLSWKEGREKSKEERERERRVREAREGWR